MSILINQIVSSINRTLEVLHGNYLIIINYHYFSENSSDEEFACSQKELIDHLTYIKGNQSVLPILKALEILETHGGDGKLPKEAVCITIDDCDESFYRIAWPIFRSFSIPIHLNVITGHIGQYIESGIGRKLMDYKQVEELMKSSLVTLGSHTMNHPFLHSLSSSDLRKEIHDSKMAIESIQGACEIFCYPYGGRLVVTENTEKMILEAGYEYALTTTGGLIRKGTDRYRIGRTNIKKYRVGFKQISYCCNGIIALLSKTKSLMRGERFYSKVSPKGKIGF